MKTCHPLGQWAVLHRSHRRPIQATVLDQHAPDMVYSNASRSQQPLGTPRYTPAGVPPSVSLTDLGPRDGTWCLISSRLSNDF